MMWSKLRKRLLQAKPVVGRGGQHLTSDCNHEPGSCSCATGELALPKINANESYFQVHDVQEDQCRCSPLLQIQKHLFGTFRTKRAGSHCSVNERIDELGEGKKNQDVDAVILSPSSDGLVNGVSIRLKDDKSKLAEFDSSKCTCDMSVHDRIIKEQSPRLEQADCSFERKESEQLTIDRGFTAMPLSSSCVVMQTSSPRLKIQGRSDDTNGLTASGQRQDKDFVIASCCIDQKVLEHPVNDSENKSCYTGTETNCQMINISDSVDANNTERCSENILGKGEDKEGSTDSGHHLSDGDAEKDPGSPDLEPDDYDGRESGYTTFDEVQLFPLEQAKLYNRNNMFDNVFEEEQPTDQVQVNDHLFYYSQPVDLSLSTGELGGHPGGCDWSPSATALNSLVKGSPGHEATSVEAATVGLGDADDVSSQRWKEVDYVPADACVSKIYEDNSAAGTNDVYAIVPRNGNSKLEEAPISEALACKVGDLPEKRMETRNRKTCEQGDLDSCSPEAGSFSMNGEKSCGNSVVSDASVFIALDSDDGENVPPLPQRNYGLYVSPEDAESEFSKFAESENENEQIHMTWDELMKEAKDMGIPLNGPHCDNSSVYVASEVFLESEFSISQISDTNNRSSKEQQEQVLDKIMTGKIEMKKGSPIKEKFRLPNLFVKKNRSTKTETVMKNDKHASAKEKKSSIFRHHSSVDIQKRCLPCLPPSEQQRDSSFLIIGQAGCSNGQMSSQTKTHRMAVSMHLPISDGDSWESSTNILHGMACGDTNGQRPRRIFSDSSQWNNSSSASMLLFGDPENGTANCSDLSASDNRNVNADFIQSFSKLKDCGWYWGPLGWENAEAKLEDKPDGSFLVRDSSDDRYILSLSFRSQNVTHHTRIEHYKGKFSFYSQPKSHGVSTIVEFIEKAMEHSQSGRFLYFLRPRAPGLPPTPVQLLFPISRLRNMHSLQHMCRFVILKHVRRDLIDYLPMPQRLKEYLRQTQYYIEHSDCDSMGHQYFSPAW